MSTKAKPTARVSESSRVAPLPASKPPAPPVTPEIPPQLVACGERDFYRITQSSLQVFEIASTLPPPQIRGGRISQQTNEVAIGEPLNVFSPASGSVLVIAKAGVYRYDLGQKQARRYAPIPASAPLVAWPDPQHDDSFRVRTIGDEKLRQYSLAGLPSARADSPPAPAQAARHVQELPGFDARLFTVLAGGGPLYSTANGLARAGQASPVAPLPGGATVLFADAAPNRYWAADASGGLTLGEPKQSAAPLFSTQVPGVVIDSAVEGERVAVLSMALDGQSYRPTVTIYSHGKEQARLSVGPTVAMRPPQLDLCLIAGRPWVVVGSTRWMQLLDWQSRRLLAEW